VEIDRQAKIPGCTLQTSRFMDKIARMEIAGLEIEKTGN